MKKYLFLLSILFTSTIHAQTITPEQTKDSIGKTETVCGKVFNVHSAMKMTYINFGNTYPNQTFTIVIKKEDVAKFSYSLDSLAKKNVCVTGLLKIFQEKPEIELTDPSQLQLK